MARYSKGSRSPIRSLPLAREMVSYSSEDSILTDPSPSHPALLKRGEAEGNTRALPARTHIPPPYTF